MSKRGMEMQGGDERYGGSSNGTETPMDTPTKATAAQMARRKIATMKGRTGNRTPAPAPAPAFGGFGSSQNNAPAQQGGFSFGQSGNSTPASGFSFGQSQQNGASQSAGSGFSFGSQPQASSSNSFTFGQSAPQSNGGFTFGANSSSSSFPPAGSNPFANTNGGSNPSSTPTAFSGSIFNFNSSQSPAQPSSNGFSFGASTPSKPAEAAGPSEADKQEIARREPYLDSAQQKRLEEIVASYLPDSPSSYQKAPLEYLPSNVVSQVVEYLKSLSPPSFGATANVESLFVQPYRSKAKTAWVTDAERKEFKESAGKLSSADQEKLAQVVKDTVASLKSKANHELPSVEFLPNDVQRRMLEVAKSALEPVKPQNIFAQASPATPTQTTSPAQSPAAAEETPKSNPFASIKFNATPAPQTPSAGFSFGAQASTPAAATTNGAPKTPSFSFSATPAKGDETSTTSKPPTFSFSSATPAKKDEPAPSAPKTPSFSFGSTTPAKPSEKPAEAPKTPSFSFGSATPAKKDDAPATAPSFSFSKPATPAPAQSPAADQPKPNPFASISTPKSSIAPQALSTPQNNTPASSFNFHKQAAQTPAPALSSNAFNTTTAQAPATAPVQKSMPSFNFASATAPPKQPSFSGFKSSDADMSAVASPSAGIAEGSNTLTKLQRFNMAFKAHLATIDNADSMDGLMKFYLQESHKLKQAATASKAAAKPASTAFSPKAQPPAASPSTPSAHASAASQSQSTPASTSKATPGFQLNTASPQKPLSATASLFSNILDSPEKPKKAAGSAPSANTPSFSFAPATAVPKVGDGLASPFKPSTVSSTPASSSASAPPKFGGGSTGSTTNFLSAFGASAAKEAEKEKAKRKAEDFDSDEDDEAEWERQDKEKQEAKRKALEEAAKNASAFKVQAPAGTTTTAAPSFSVPKFGNTGGSTSGFLSAFGASAEKEAAKQKAKRKAEDFDSDEDDEAEWERQDKEKQAAKRQALEQQSKKVMKNVGGKFEWVDADEAEAAPAKAPSPPKTNGTPTFSFGAATNGTSTPAAPAKTGGLFDRIEKPAQQESTPQKPLFSFSSTSPAVDQTWKPDSPIRFGDASADGSTTPTGSPAKKPFTFSAISSTAQDKDDDEDETPAPQPTKAPIFNFGLSAATPPGGSTPEGSKPASSWFPSTPASGSASPAPSIFANLGKPTPSFNFGGASSNLTPGAAASNTSSIFASAGTSRATTPGATTAEDTTAANTDAEEDAAPPEKQNDMTALTADEIATEDVLAEYKMRCSKFTRGQGNGWEVKGTGIGRLLKNKTTGNARVLFRLIPSGTVALNVNVMKNKDMYAELGAKAAKMVFAEESGLNTYSALFGTVEKRDDWLGKLKEVTGQ